jgi:PPIC-type PPIASE domain
VDLPHLVQAVAGRLLRSPALHFAVLGGLLFAAVPTRAPAPEAVRLVVPTSRVETAIREFERVHGRPLTPEDRERLTQAVVDEEVLYAYALRLGLDKEPVVERRLAQIAAFVAENPHEAKSAKELANEAHELGLNDGDVVVRRILIDGAKRLIRAAVLAREPSDSLLEEYLRQHPDQFRLPARARISHVVVDARMHREWTEHTAHELLARLRADSVPPEQAGAYGDHGLVASNLPALPHVELERRFGYRFVKHLDRLPMGSWQGPVPSRYGLHLVFVEERIPERIASLTEVRRDVSARVRNQLADEWLAARMEQLRAEFQVEMRGSATRSGRR